MRVTCPSIENTEHLLTPVHCQFRSLIFWKMLHYCDIVTALTTIHHQSKLQINMQVVTCEKMKMSGGLSLVPRGLGTRLTKPSG